jgi:hypothetical protein
MLLRADLVPPFPVAIDDQRTLVDGICVATGLQVDRAIQILSIVGFTINLRLDDWLRFLDGVSNQFQPREEHSVATFRVAAIGMYEFTPGAIHFLSHSQMIEKYFADIHFDLLSTMHA